MSIVKTACDDYYITTVYEAIRHLKKKPWTPNIPAAIEEIHTTLMLQRDLEKAAEFVDKFV